MAMRMPRLQQRLGYPLVALVCLVATTLLGWTSYGHRVNNIFYDLYFRQRGPQQPSEAIVIVAIDDATLAEYGPLPLERSRLAQGIAALREAQPALIALDLLLTDRGDEEADRALEAALAGPLTLVNVGVNRDAAHPPIVLATALEAGGGKWLRPRPDFAFAAAAIGQVHADPDGDGVSRQVLLEKEADQQRYWTFALECFRLWLAPAGGPITEDQDSLKFETSAGPIEIPAARTEQRALLINYAGDNGTFPQVSFARLGKDPAVAAQLRSKIVLVGVTAQASGDRLFTPISSGVGMAGVEIHANILNTLLTGDYLLRATEGKALLGMFAVVLATIWGLTRLQGWMQAAWQLGLGAFVVAAPYNRFLEGEVWPGFSLLLAFGITLLGGEIYQVLVVRRSFRESERRRHQSQQRFEMAAHEMRTPLAAIQASSELLARYPLDGARREQMVQLLYEESKRLGRLVERFLSVERLSAGEMELRRERVDLAALLRSIVQRLLPLAARKGVQLAAAENTEAIEIDADEELLEFAISNLVTNAVKYSPAGTQVSVGCEREGAQAQVHVTDSGPGMSPEETGHIFDRFYRTASAEHSAHPGFGLGLAIAREIARHHGGDVRVESAPGRGSRFTVLLPLKSPTPADKVISR
jgi:signal transduction histidine kinase